MAAVCGCLEQSVLSSGRKKPLLLAAAEGPRRTKQLVSVSLGKSQRQVAWLLPCCTMEVAETYPSTVPWRPASFLLSCCPVVH